MRAGIEARVVEWAPESASASAATALPRERHGDAPGRLRAPSASTKARRAIVKRAPLLRIGAGHLRGRIGAVSRGIEFELQRLRRHRHAGLELERPRVDAARQVPGQIIEAAAHLAVEIDQSTARRNPIENPSSQPERHAQDAPDAVKQARTRRTRIGYVAVGARRSLTDSPQMTAGRPSGIIPQSCNCASTVGTAMSQKSGPNLAYPGRLHRSGRPRADGERTGCDVRQAACPRCSRSALGD